MSIPATGLPEGVLDRVLGALADPTRRAWVSTPTPLDRGMGPVRSDAPLAGEAFPRYAGWPGCSRGELL